MKDFIKLLSDALERDAEIKSSDSFRDYEEWDSLAALAVLALINENYDITIPRVEFDQLITVQDLYKKVTGNVEE